MDWQGNGDLGGTTLFAYGRQHPPSPTVPAARTSFQSQAYPPAAGPLVRRISILQFPDLKFTAVLAPGNFRALCHHAPSSHLVAKMPRMKTTAAKTPIAAESFSAARLSTNTIDARSPSFT